MAKAEIELPDGRIVVVDQSNPEEVAAVKAKILQEFPDLAPKQGGRERALEARMEAQRRKRAGEGPLTSGWNNFWRGADRIVSGDVSPREYGEAFETSIRSMTAPVGGDYVAAAGETAARFATGKPFNPNAIAEQRARREELAARSPTQALASEALGFGGLSQLVTRAAPVLGTTAGSTVANSNRATNAAKVATEAAVTTAIGEGLKGEDVGDVAQASGLAAVIAPPVSAAVRGLTQGVMGAPSGVRSTVSGADNTEGVSMAAVRSLAQRLNISPDELVEEVIKFRQANNGQMPRIAELLDDASIDNIKQLSAQRAGTGDILNTAEEVAALERPVQMRETLSGGRTSKASPEALSRERDRQLDAALRQPRGDLPAVADEEIDPRPFIELFEENPELEAGLKATVRRKFARATNGENGEPFTVDLADQLRRSLRERSRQVDGFDFKEGADAVRDLTGQASEDYAKAMQRYAEQSQFVEGVERGRKVLTERQEDITENIPDLGKPERMGAARGARSEITTRAGNSAAGAVTTARALQEPGTVARVASTLGPQTARKFADVGRTQMRAATNLARLSPRTELPPSLASAAGDLTELAAAASGRAGSQLIARVIEGTAGRLRALGVPPNAATNMARLLTDPARTEEVVAKLLQVGLKEADVQRLTQQHGTGLASAISGEAADTLFPEQNE